MNPRWSQKFSCNEYESFSSYDHLIIEIKVCATSFNFCRFSHIHKQDICVTHNLAKHVSGLSVWLKDISLHINSILLAYFSWFVFF